MKIVLPAVSGNCSCIPNGAFILRPVRLLETASYFFPPADFLSRKYKHSNIIIRIRHLFKALSQAMRFGIGYILFRRGKISALKTAGQKRLAIQQTGN